MIILNHLEIIFWHQQPYFSYEKRSGNHFSHMNFDENTTPDRFEALPVLLDHLNDEFMMVLTNLYEHFRKVRKFKIDLNQHVLLRKIRGIFLEGFRPPKTLILFSFRHFTIL